MYMNCCSIQEVLLTSRRHIIWVLSYISIFLHFVQVVIIVIILSTGSWIGIVVSTSDRLYIKQGSEKSLYRLIKK